MPQWLSNWLNTLKSYSLHQLLPAILLFFAGLLLIRLVRKLAVSTMEKTRLGKPIQKLIQSLLNIVLFVILFLTTASLLGVDITSIVALASVLTLALSLALQNALTNVIGGFTLLHTQPFVSGDFVEIAGQSGTVTEVGLSYTKLTTPDGKIISIPNSSVVAAEIVNYTTTGTRRLDITISVSYDDKPEKVIAALKEAADIPAVLADPAPFAGLKSYGDSAMVYVLQVWTATADHWPSLYTINQNIKTVFDREGICMTYPHLNVHLDK